MRSPAVLNSHVAAATAIPATENLGVIAAVVLAALLHAAWNGAAHHIPDRAVGLALIGVAYTVISAAVVPFVAVPDAGAWGWLLGSVALQVVYNLLLIRSYRLGAFSQVYPLARGVSPMVVVAAVTVTGQPLPTGQTLGVAVLCAGLMVLVFAGGSVVHTGRDAVTAAILTGLCIATYTVLDGMGIRAAHSTAGYIAWLFLLQGPILPAIITIQRRCRILHDCRLVWRLGLTSGVGSLAAYGIVLWAQTRTNLATVAALRELSILFGAVIGPVFFREKFGTWRIIGAALAVAGIALLNI